MTTRPREVTTAAVADRIAAPGHEILDTRPIAAYNGWRLRGEQRGGHVSTARSVPARWTRRDDWRETLADKDITAETPVTLYGYDAEVVRDVAETLTDAGYEDVSVYPRFRAEWLADPDRPLDRLARYRNLVYPAWLDALCRGADPPEYDGSDHVVCHVHYDSDDDYRRGGVPGAIALDTVALESPSDWNRRPAAELREALLSHGIRHDTTVVVYGRSSGGGCGGADSGSTAGQLAAMRCAAIMLYAGVADVRVLNGGLSAWTDAGFELETDPTDPTPASEFGVEVPGRPELFIDTPEAKAWLADDDAELVSVRSRSEFVGTDSGYDYIDERGRIPGAVFGHCGSDAYDMENYRNVDGTMREYGEVAAEWAQRGVVPDERVAFYCGTGWRGSEAFLNAYLMGWSDIAVYDGGWQEWSSDPDNPVEYGVPDALDD